MSLTKRFIEMAQDRDDLVAALEVAIEKEMIEHAASLGIAKKIIADNGTEGLSQRQKEVLQKHIFPILTPVCDQPECSNRIEIRDLPAAISEEFDEGGRFCEECLHNRAKIRWLAEKDD